MASGSSDPRNRSARGALLARIVTGLQDDKRVTAAWLGGSLGRGTGDDLSHIDLWIVVHGEAMPGIAADPLGFAQELTTPVHAFPVPANAPSGGAYLFSIVDASDSFQQVDWYWTPAPSAARPPHTRVLFERALVPSQPSGAGPDLTALEEFVVHCAREALAMAFIAVKPIRRSDQWAFSRHIQYIAQFIANLVWAIEHQRIPAHDDHVDPGLPTSIPMSAGDQLDLLLMQLDRFEPHLNGLPLSQRSGLDHALRSVRKHIGQHLSDRPVRREGKPNLRIPGG